MPSKRTYAEYGDACAMAHAMDVIGDKWSMIIVRELMLGPKRFNELFSCAHGITPAVLTGRLRELEQAGVLTSGTLPAPHVHVYDLTDWGRGLEPIVRALGRWAQESPHRSNSGGMTPDAVVLAMRTMAPTEPAPEPIGLHLQLYDRRSRQRNRYDFRLAWSRTDLIIERGVQTDPQATVTSDSSVWSRVIFKGLDIAAAERDHDVVMAGDRRVVQTVIQAFAV